MTAAGVRRPSPGTVPARALARPAAGLARVTWLYLLSRRVPAALGLTGAAGVLLWADLNWHWTISGGAAAREIFPLTIEAAAAAVISVTSYGPFGETERAAGRWLPYLRLAAAIALTAAAFGALASGAGTGGHLPGGALALLRDLTGMAGTGLLCAAAIGGAFAWAGPLAYLVITEGAFAGSWTTPWDWPTRPPHDLGGALCASAVFAAGLVLITIRGGREHAAR
jgi:hypothetical protein